MGQGQRFGNYELVERIGRGGMAEVWRARSRGAAGFEKEVVLKRVLPSLLAGSDFAELLIREAKIAARLHHPNVVSIFDLGEQDGAYFIAMEYVAGCDLATAVAHHPSPWLEQGELGLSLPLRLFIVAEAARALDYAHRRQDDEGRPLHIVHRDISPQNILLGFEGEVKVADFGIARADAAGLGAEEDPRLLRGKFAYMSPEQACSESLDGRSDVFALGVVLWELVAGRRLFKAPTTEETLDRVRRADVPEVSTQAWPPGLAEVLSLALAPTREQRFATAGEFGDALVAVLHRSFDAWDNADLARVLVELLPNAAEQRVNKLRVDLGQRVDGDAARTMTALTAAPVVDEQTRAFPVSRRMSVLVRPVPSIVARPEHGSAEALEQIALAHGAVAGAAPGAEVVWSFADGDHDALAAALRVVHEWRTGQGLGPALVIEGEARVWQGGRAAEVDREVLAEARSRLAEASTDETRCAPEVAGRMEARYRFGDEEWPVLHGYRLRVERDFAAHLRLPLIGRRAELTRLVEALEQSAAGGRAIWVVGEAGSGKSRLLAELHARASSALLLTGRGGSGGSRSFALLADLFADLTGVDDSDDEVTRAEKVNRLRVLGLGERLLSRVRELVSNADAEPLDRPGRPRGLDLCAALGKAVAALAHDTPVVVALEDLQGADEASLQLLPWLRASLERPRVLTVFTTRPPPPVAPLAEPQVRLDALDSGSAGRLFARAAGGRSVEAELGELLDAELDGTPGAIVDVARLLVDQQRLAEEAGVFRLLGSEPLPIPSRWRSSRLLGLSELSTDDRGVLAALAVLRQPTDIATLAAICAEPVVRVELCLRRLLDLGLVGGAQGESHRVEGRWGGVGGDVRLPAELELRGGAMARRALVTALGDERVQALHGRVSRVLGSAGAAADERIERLAFHAARASDRREAPRWLALSAARARARGELSLAAERYAEAARIGLELRFERDLEEEDDDACTLFALAAETALEAGDADLAAQLLAAAPRDASDAKGYARLAGARATVAEARGDYRGASDYLQSVLDAERALDPEGRVRLALRRGICELRVGDPSEAGRCFELVVAGAEPLENAISISLCAQGHAWLSVAHGNVGDERAAERASRVAMRLSLRAGDGESRLAALFAAAARAEARLHLDDAASLWADAHALATEEDSTMHAPEVAVRAALTAALIADEGSAAVFAEHAARLGHARRDVGATALAAAVRGALAARAHPEPDFVPAVVRGIDGLEAAGRSREAALALEMLAVAHLALGDPPAAIRTLGRALPLAERAQNRPLAQRLGRAAERLAEGQDPYLEMRERG